MQDHDIIELYIKRDERAIEETAAKYGAYCRKIAFNILYDVFGAEECVNDTYLRTWNAIPPTIPRIFSSFLAKITRNLAIDKYNFSKVKKRNAISESLDELSEIMGEDSLSEELEISELSAAISRFLSAEKPLSRRIFIKRYFFEEDLQGIAREHGITLTSVKVTLHRQRARLAKFLSEEGFFL